MKKTGILEMMRNYFCFSFSAMSFLIRQLAALSYLEKLCWPTLLITFADLFKCLTYSMLVMTLILIIFFSINTNPTTHENSPLMISFKRR